MPPPLDGRPRATRVRAFLHSMQRTLAGSVLLLALSGCGSSTTSDAAKHTFLDGVAEIRHTPSAETLRGQLLKTIRELREADPSAGGERRGKTLALKGFAWTVRGMEARIEIRVNDSGNLEASVNDAKRADRYLKKGADLLRAAGRAFGVRIGELNGH
jgi:hypothetical protein